MSLVAPQLKYTLQRAQSRNNSKYFKGSMQHKVDISANKRNALSVMLRLQLNGMQRSVSDLLGHIWSLQTIIIENYYAYVVSHYTLRCGDVANSNFVAHHSVALPSKWYTQATYPKHLPEIYVTS